MIVLCVVLSCPAHAQNDGTRIRIAAEPIADALAEYAIQASLSIDESGMDLHDKASNPLDGVYSRQAGLERLLAGSGLTFEFVDPNSVRIYALSSAARRFPQPAIESVVVTATKREEVAQNLAGSISVVTGDEISDLGAETLEDLTSQVADLTATNLGPGEDKLFVRGLTDSVLPGLSESVVGLYLDDSRIADDAPDPGLVLVDIDRVEILRGPQGTLYGAGSLDGIIRIVTRKPVLDDFQAMAGGTVSITEDGSLSNEFEGMLNIPIISDELALRVVAYAEKLSGYVADPLLNASDTNDTTTAGARAALVWHPDARWAVAANLALQNVESADSQYYLQALGPENRDNYLPEPHGDRFLLGSITANGDLGWADLVSNTSYVKRNLTNQFDATQAWPQLTGLPFGPSAFDFQREIQSFSQETRMSSVGSGPWQWLLGVYLSHRDEDFDSSLTGPGASGSSVEARAETREDRLNEAAIFGELTYTFWSDFSLTAGARVFDASHRLSALSTGPLAGSPMEFSGSNQQDGVAPKLVFSYRPNFNTTLYAEYSEGYRLGGLNSDGPPDATGENGTTFDSDVLRNYETGAKVRFLDGRAIANGALYFDEWHDVQSDEIAPDGAFYILNAGTVRDIGAEFEFAIQPIVNLTLKGTAFWNNAVLSRSFLVTAGEEPSLPGAPNVSFGATARYDFLFDAQQDAFISVDYGYVGPSHLGFSESAPGMGNYQLANLRAGLNFGEWEFVLFLDNLANDKGNTFAFGNPFLPASDRQITTPRPRTLGLSLTWSN